MKAASRWKDYLTSYLFVIPGLILFAMFYVYPFYQSYRLSFFKWSGYTPMAKASFAGLDNYRRALEDTVFWDSVLRVLKTSTGIILLEVPIALLLALLVSRLARGGLYRTIFFIPTILSPIIVGLIWKWMYEPKFGIINQLLETIGLSSWTHAWLAESETAMGAVAATFIWETFGTYFLLFLVGLTGIDRQLYEAASMEGASGMQSFRYVTLPLLIPTMILVSILLVLGSMQIFGQVVIMTNGGPGYATEVPAMRILKEAFDNVNMSYSTTLSVLFGFMLVVVSFIQLFISRRYGAKLYD
ncbi:sugar ABC transporter permease [Paenibacillus sp. J5C_2022]|uniref:Carbohydrate ABC transporter permease n=1 Tax=Paenibacillus chungangensis TaxID=696535 RepID=A0ABW3HKT5_9BACL|nr:sugar ABC transporter permease [Paenibacillus sp. J5C2022]MCU6711333.1 sugar ABC transporter permease [Paenibacillus sp. J5C2022]